VAGVGPLDPVVASRTLLATTSEFGRRIGENSTGTDHGAAAPMLLVGPGGTPANGAVLTAGIHGDHPNMGTTLLPADNLTMTTDLRRVYQSMLEGWLHDPDPAYGAAFAALPGLFQQVTA
jgi:uncharacterized protein (DUF1501 family)